MIQLDILSACVDNLRPAVRILREEIRRGILG